MKIVNSNLYANIEARAEGIRSQKISPVDILDACLKRIEETNPKTNAFITVIAEQSKGLARSAEKEIKTGKWRGPLHGIPAGIKDFYDTAGIKTTGSGKKMQWEG